MFAASSFKLIILLSAVASMANPIPFPEPPNPYGVEHKNGYLRKFTLGTNKAACGFTEKDFEKFVLIPTGMFNKYTPNGADANHTPSTIMNPLCGKTVRIYYGGAGTTVFKDATVVGFRDDQYGYDGNLWAGAAVFKDLGIQADSVKSFSWMLI